MPFLHSNGAALRSVRLHSAGGDPLRARQRLERALADVDWSPPGLAPQALLFVRRLVADGRRGVRPVSEGGSFGHGVSAALREHARAARRPWLHADAAEAAAVCFSDEAELVACLLRDWVRGAVAQRWWWHGVLGHLDVTRWLRVQVLAHAERLVPALVLLAERGEAAACVARLDDADAAQALRCVQRAYGLSEWAGTPGPAEVVRPEGGVAPTPEPPAHDESTIDATRALRRLLSLVPELHSPLLQPAQRRLLALALALVRAPGWARTPELRVALHARLPESGVAAVVDASPAAQPIVESQRAVPSAPQTIEPAAKNVADEAPAMPARALRRGSAEDVTPPAHAPRAAPTLEHDSSTLLDAPLVEALRDPSTAPEPQVAATPATTPVPQPSRAAVTAQTPPPVSASVPNTARHTVRTYYGGVFYLLNATLALRVYGDFTMPRTPGLALSPWDLLAWTGHAWFGDDFAHDPVWALLASLSGRQPHTAPGRGFIAPTRWALDPAWLAPWGQVDRLQVHAGARRLRVLHPEGFAVFDVPRDRALRPLQQARALCADIVWLRSASFARAPVPIARAPRADAPRWLQHWLAHLNARLRRTLGGADAPRLLCCHDAVVEVSTATVDVHLALASLPLPIRFAGLDRDPGWIPAAGRSLMFRFT
jgi:hypothetical protein